MPVFFLSTMPEMTSAGLKIVVLIYLCVCTFSANTCSLDCVCHQNHDIQMSEEKKLAQHLLNKYRVIGQEGRPVLNGSEASVVYFGLGLIQVELDEHKKMMISSMWIKMKWQDEYLNWDPAEWGGVKRIRLRANSIWVPDIMLINTADPNFEIRNSQITVYHSGNVTWVPHMIFRSSCSFNITSFPFDRQNCSMWFSSWTHPAREINLHLASGGLDLSTFEADFHKSRSWDIQAHSSQRIYNGDPDEFPVLFFTLVMERRLVFSSYILTLPCIFLAFLTLVVFCLPAERPDRTALAMSLFSSFLVLLLILVEAAPPTATSVPKLGLYYCFNMVIIMLSIFLSSLVVNVNKLSSGRRKMPRCLNIISDFLAQLLLISCRKIKTCNPNYHSELSTDESSGKALENTNGHAYNNTSNPSFRNTNTMFTAPILHFDEKMSCSLDSSRTIGMVLKNIEHHLADVRTILNVIMEREKSKEDEADVLNQTGKEWLVLASVLDRLFLLCYLAGIIWSLMGLFPRPEDF